jgi:hypothetical protein
MLNLAQGVTVWLVVSACDMRKQMDSLLGVVADMHGKPASAGNLYVFLNRRRNYVRVLFLDASGTCMFSKRLFEGTVGSRWAAGLNMNADTIEISSGVLGELLAGGRVSHRDLAA